MAPALGATLGGLAPSVASFSPCKTRLQGRTGEALSAKQVIGGR